MDYEMVDALSHPIRLEILQLLRGRVASSMEISQEIGQKLQVVSYHAGTLVKCGCLELVERKVKRGGVENFFAITPRRFSERRD